MSLNNQVLGNKASLYSVLSVLKDTINYNMNCVKVATVIEFDKDTLKVKCRINNKRLRYLNDDGNQHLENYPDIYANACFMGWGDTGATWPIKNGMEGILLFNDRELETWFLTGEGGNLAYDRCHDLTDALFICGIHSQPNISLLQYIEDGLNLFYKNSNVLIKENETDINTAVFKMNNQQGASGSFTTKDNKLITVTNGIITGIN